jgi:hypothetical protein
VNARRLEHPAKRYFEVGRLDMTLRDEMPTRKRRRERRCGRRVLEPCAHRPSTRRGLHRPGLVHGVYMALFQLKDALKQRLCVTSPVRPHQCLTAHRGQSYLDIEPQRLSIELCNFVRPVGCLGVHLKRFGHMNRES